MSCCCGDSAKNRWIYENILQYCLHYSIVCVWSSLNKKASLLGKIWATKNDSSVTGTGWNKWQCTFLSCTHFWCGFHLSTDHAFLKLCISIKHLQSTTTSQSTHHCLNPMQCIVCKSKWSVSWSVSQCQWSNQLYLTIPAQNLLQSLQFE